ncbi:MAG: GlsB/YeaQ/YmgE family stress response membrane protein [Bryobacteraceae bacterium]
MLHMIGHMIFGLIIGLIARLLVPGPNPHGLIATMLLGLVGAWLGGFLGRALGLYPPGHPAGFFMALIGAVIVIFIYDYAVGRPRRYATAFPVSYSAAHLRDPYQRWCTCWRIERS